jgi:3-dehydroquinate dehydratase
MISMFIGDKTIQQLKSVFMEELKQMFPTLMQSFASNMQKDLIDQLEHQSLQKFETIAFNATSPLRKLAILIGLIWGFIANLILNLF